MWANQTARKMATVISVTFIGSLNLHMFVFRSERRRNEHVTRRIAARDRVQRDPTHLEVLSKDQWINADLPHEPCRIGLIYLSPDLTAIRPTSEKFAKKRRKLLLIEVTLIFSKKKFPSFKDSSESWKIDKSLEKYHSFKRWTRINVTFVSFLKNINFLF